MGELEILQDRFDDMQADNVHVIWGHGIDETLGDNIKLSLVVTNFDTAHENKEEIVINNSGEDIVSAVEDNPQVEDTQAKIDEFTQQQNEQPVVDVPQAEPVTDEGLPVESVTPEPNNLEMTTPSGPQFTMPKDDSSFVFGNNNDPFVNWDNDDVFNRMVKEPAINRSELFAASQNKTQVAVEDPVSPVYYELPDDTYDVFHGMAD